MNEVTEMDLRFRVVLTLLMLVAMFLFFLIIPILSKR